MPEIKTFFANVDISEATWFERQCDSTNSDFLNLTTKSCQRKQLKLEKLNQGYGKN
jgi:hypothetical protein